MRNRMYERQIAACDQHMAEHAAKFRDIMAKAEEESRPLTDEERQEIGEHQVAIETLKGEKAEAEANDKTVKEMEGLANSMPHDDDEGIRGVQVVDKSPEEVKRLGDQFIESKGYKELIDGGLTGEFSTGPVDLNTKTTLTTTPGTALTPREYQPGVVETLFQRNYVADLCASSTTAAAQVAYVVEQTATNASAATAEAAAKPESAFVFSEALEPIRKIATILPVSDEMLADAPQIQAYLNGRLRLFIMNTEEAQLLLGSGTTPNIQGFLASGRAIGTYARGTVDSNAVALFKAMNGTRGSSQLDPDAIVIHPTNWQAIRLATDTSGQFFGGGPFYGPYGGPQGPASASQFSADAIWNTRVVVTSNITVGTALVGAFSTASEVVRRQGLTVEATNSHSTFFASNITTLRAEERLGLKVYRPAAFTAVTGLS